MILKCASPNSCVPPPMGAVGGRLKDWARSDQFITSVGQLMSLKTNLMTSLLRREAIERNDILQLNLLIESIKVSQWHYHASHNKHFYAKV